MRGSEPAPAQINQSRRRPFSRSGKYSLVILDASASEDPVTDVPDPAANGVPEPLPGPAPPVQRLRRQWPVSLPMAVTTSSRKKLLLIENHASSPAWRSHLAFFSQFLRAFLRLHQFGHLSRILPCSATAAVDATSDCCALLSSFALRLHASVALALCKIRWLPAQTECSSCVCTLRHSILVVPRYVESKHVRMSAFVSPVDGAALTPVDRIAIRGCGASIRVELSAPSPTPWVQSTPSSEFFGVLPGSTQLFERRIS